jgi:hypothetical protein
MVENSIDGENVFWLNVCASEERPMLARIPARKFVRRMIPAAAALALTVSAGGCDLLDAMTDTGGLVQVFATHHATPRDGDFPGGAEGEDRVFETEDGWTVVLDDAYVVTSSVTLQHCDGSSVALDLHWGQLPENLTWADLEVRNMGSLDAPAGQYCAVVVDYEPYDPDSFHGEPHEQPQIDELVGATMYLRGYALLGDARIEFEFRNEEEISVELDLRHIDNGGPFTMREREPFPRELTVSKTYDRFFDPLELDITEGLDQEDASQIVLDVLADETRVTLGTIIESI